jgi:hypothetical protein
MTRKYTSAYPWTEYPVAEGNFDKTRKPITQIIIHSTVGKYENAVAWFGNPKAGTSAHYVIANDGRLAAMLEEFYTAYHSGNYATNQSSIGIEHEWYSGMVITDKLYEVSAILVADLCKYYKLACNRGVVKGHNEIVATGCPNKIDVDRIVRQAQAILTPPVTDPCANLRLEFAATEKRLVAEKDQAIKDKEIIIDNLQSALSDRKSELSSCGINLKSANENYTEYLKKATELQEEVDTLERKVNMLTKSLEEANKALADVEDKDKEVTTLRNQVLTLTNANNKLSGQLKVANNKLDMLSKSLKNKLYLFINEFVKSHG